MSPAREQPLERRRPAAAPPAVFTARHFCIREVGILSEQGVLDRARMLLARRAQREPRDPEAYLDAIRLELGVPSSGSAWRAWLERAFESGAEVADRVAAIIPQDALAAALIEVAPSALLEQADRGSALDLLRLRACALLASDDRRALDLLETDGVSSSSEAELLELGVDLLVARAFAEPARVERLAAQHSAAAGSERLRATLAVARDYRALTLTAKLPTALERVLGLLGHCDAATDLAVLAHLDRDLRAQPAVYVAWADAIAAAAPALVDRWLAHWHARTTPVAADRAITAEVVAGAAAAVEGDALRFVPLPATELALYRKHARPKALTAIVERAPAVQLEALRAVAAQHTGRARRVLAQLGNDPALALIDQLARLSRLAT